MTRAASKKREPFKVSLSTLARVAALAADARSVPVNPFRPAEHPPQATPAKAQIAQDDALVAQAGWAASQYASSVSAYGIEFLGFTILAELAQRPEYRNIVEIISEEMTRRWIKLTAKGDDDKSDKLGKIEAELHRLKARQVFRQAAEGDGQFGRGHIFIDLGEEDGSELATPIGDGGSDSIAKVGRGKLKALRSVEAIWIYPQGYNTSNPLSPGWYAPQTWYVMGRPVHHTRMLTMIGREVPDLLKPSYSFGGLSLIQQAKPYVDNWLRTRQSVSDLIASFSVRGIKTDLENAVATGDAGENLVRRVQLFNLTATNLGTMILNDSEEFFNVSTPLGTLDALQAQALEQISSVTKIPLVKFTGITPTGLNACLPGDTLILTDRGEVPIRDVLLSDRVITRRGFAPLTFSGITKYATELFEIRTANATLQCTPNHPIWLTSTNEFVAAENVRPGDRLLLIGEKVDTLNTPLQSHGEAGGGGDVLTATTQAGIAAQNDLFSFIVQCGRRIAARYPQASTFTMSTAIGRITSYQTLSRCLLDFTASITELICGRSRPSAQSLSHVNDVGAHSSLRNFRAENAFARMHASMRTDEQTELVRRNRHQHAFVTHAIAHSSRNAVTLNSAHASVLQPVKIVRDTCVSIMKRILTSSMGDSARPRDWRNAASPVLVPDAGVLLSQRDDETRYTAPKAAKIAPSSDDCDCVVSVKKVPANEWVYDLTVGEGYLPEFFANGILTHNSSEGEIRVFYDHIHAMQEHMFRAPLSKLLNLVQISLFGEVDPDIGFEFEHLYSLDEKERAEVEEIRARTGASLVASGTITRAEERARVAHNEATPYPGLDLDTAVLAPVSELVPIASLKIAASEAGLTTEADALQGLADTGLFPEITPERILEAQNEPPEPEGEGGQPDADPVRLSLPSLAT